MNTRFPRVDPDSVLAVLRIMNLGRDITASLTPHFERIDLTEARFTTVMMIYRHERESGHSTPSRLADQAGIGRAAMSQLLDSLSDADWVVRDVHPDDRRKVRIQLTPKGRRRLDRFLPQHYARVAEVMAGLSKANLRDLLDLLDKVEVPTDRSD